MNPLDALFDRYALFARQRPALLMLFPAAVAVLVVFPSLQTWWATLIALVGACGVALALGEFAQGRGKPLEPRLYAAWGGMPSVAMLRYRDKSIDPATKARYKAFLAGKVSGLVLPSEAQERGDPTSADDAYASASNWLRSQTRDTRRFALLFRQNIGYGFRRNLLGLRPYGISVAVLSLVVIAVDAWLNGAKPPLLVGLIVSSGALGFWLFAVTPGWVRTAAEAYARELLAACDTLAAELTASRRTKKAS